MCVYVYSFHILYDLSQNIEYSSLCYIVGCYCYPSVHNCLHPLVPWGFPGDLAVNNPPANTGDAEDGGLIPGLGRTCRRKWQRTPVFLPGKFGQWSLKCCRPWSHKESDITEHSSTQSCANLTLLIRPCSGLPTLGNFRSLLYVSESAA